MFDMKWFHEAESIKDAIDWLQKDEDAEIISGGTDVLIRMREGKDAGKALVSIHNLQELKGIEMDKDENIIIKSGTSFYNITNNEIIQNNLLSLGEACDTVGGPQIRQTGTIGGNICNGATSADSASTMTALDCDIVLQGPKGERIVPISKWYIGPGKTVRERCEIVTKFIIKKENYKGFSGYYFKYGKRNSMEIATLGCSVLVKLDSTKTKIEDCKIAYGVANPTPMRAKTAEQYAIGKDIDDKDLYVRFGVEALKDTNPRDSWRASKEFRMQLIKVMANRSLKNAIIRNGGKVNG